MGFILPSSFFQLTIITIVLYIVQSTCADQPGAFQNAQGGYSYGAQAGQNNRVSQPNGYSQSNPGLQSYPVQSQYQLDQQGRPIGQPNGYSQQSNSYPTPQQPQAMAFNPQPPPPMRGPTSPLYSDNSAGQPQLQGYQQSIGPVQTTSQQMAPPAGSPFNPQPPPPMRGPTAPLYPVQATSQQMAPPAGPAFTDPNAAFTNVNPQLQSGPVNPPSALPASNPSSANNFNPFAGMPAYVPKKASSFKDYFLNMQANAKANGRSSSENKPSDGTLWSTDRAIAYNNDLKKLMDSP